MLATRQPMMHTEYLQPLDPLPTTLDAKKSPLALLAQTCSSIGKPDPPPPSNDIKRSLTPVDSGKISPKVASIYDKPSFKPYKQYEKKEGDATVIRLGSGYPHPSKTASPQTGLPPRPSSGDHLKSTSAPTSPVAAIKPKMESIPSRTPPAGSPSSHCGDHRNISSVPKHSAPLPAQTAPHVVSSFPSLSASSYKSASSGHCGCSSTPQVSAGHFPYLSDHHQKHTSDSNPLVAATAHSPYAAAYARVKTADGGTTLMPICRDPYCNNCQSAQIAAAAQACTNSSGCTQCRHDNVALSAGGYPVALPVAGALPYIPTSLASAFPASPYFYPHAAVPASAHSEQGHVCNWVSGSASCGKRFASSEELLQHLRTHTMSSSEVSNASALSATLNAQLSAYYSMQYPAAAMAASPLGLGKYPLPSALSPGAAAAIRYHPYKSSVPQPITALPGLPAGYYPYSIHDLKARFPTGVPH